MRALAPRRSLSWLLLLSFVGCGKLFEPEPNPTYDKASVFFSTARELNVDVVFEPAAEPYTGAGWRNGKLWDIVEANLRAAFDQRRYPVVISVPKDAPEMRALPPLGRGAVGTKEILAIADRYRIRRSTPTVANLFVLFLDAFYAENGAVKPEVLAVSLQRKGIIVLFKKAEALAGLGQLAPLFAPGPEPRFAALAAVTYFSWPRAASTEPRTAVELGAGILEQTIVVHELGHALGLVNDGIPLASAHHDARHGAHCTNPQCVMFHQNEGMSALRGFVTRFMNGGNLVVFGPECLADIRAYAP